MQLLDLHEEAVLERGVTPASSGCFPVRPLGDYQFGTKQGHHRFCSLRRGRFQPWLCRGIGGDFVSVQLATLDESRRPPLAEAPVRYMDGLHDNWFQPPKVTSYL